MIKERNISLKANYDKFIRNIELVKSEVQNHEWIDVPTLHDILISDPNFNLILFYEAIKFLEKTKKIIILTKERKRYLVRNESSFKKLYRYLFKREPVIISELENKIVTILKNKHLRIETLSGYLSISTKVIKNILLILEQKNIVSFYMKRGKYYHLV